MIRYREEWVYYIFVDLCVVCLTLGALGPVLQDCPKGKPVQVYTFWKEHLFVCSIYRDQRCSYCRQCDVVHQDKGAR